MNDLELFYRHAVDHHAQFAIVGRAEHLFGTPYRRCELEPDRRTFFGDACRKGGRDLETVGLEAGIHLDTANRLIVERNHDGGWRRGIRAAAIAHPQSHRAYVRAQRAQDHVGIIL